MTKEQKKNGDPLGGPTFRGDPKRFLQDTVLTFTGEDCMIWPYARSGAGYGQIYHDGKVAYVHRIACEHQHGEAPIDKPQVRHSCGRGGDGCVNPMHLDWGDQSANEADKVAHGTSNRGERQHNAKLTAEDVRQIRRLVTAGRGDQQIAELYGVHKTNIRAIRTGQSWAWLDAPATERAA